MYFGALGNDDPTGQHTCCNKLEDVSFRENHALVDSIMW